MAYWTTDDWEMDLTPVGNASSLCISNLFSLLAQFILTNVPKGGLNPSHSHVLLI